jgi:hypothetical protein
MTNIPAGCSSSVVHQFHFQRITLLTLPCVPLQGDSPHCPMSIIHVAPVPLQAKLSSRCHVSIVHCPPVPLQQDAPHCPMSIIHGPPVPLPAILCSHCHVSSIHCTPVQKNFPLMVQYSRSSSRQLSIDYNPLLLALNYLRRCSPFLRHSRQFYC